MFNLEIEKAEEPEIKLPTSVESFEKESKFQKNIYFCFIDYAKTFDCVDEIKLWQFLKEMGKPDHLTGFLRNMYAGQEETARTGHRTTNQFLIGKDYGKAVYCHPAHLTYLQSTYKIPRLDEGQAGIKIARRNINNLRYADDTTPMAERAEELNSLLMKVKESETLGLKLNIQKTKNLASGPITS